VAKVSTGGFDAWQMIQVGLARRGHQAKLHCFGQIAQISIVKIA